MRTKKLTILIIGVLLLLSFTTDNYIIPDDYLVTNEMLKDFHGEKNVDGVFSFDKAWFKNDDLKEVLIFELYTDYHRLAIYHCKTDFLFNDLIKNVELHRKVNNNSYDLADEDKKQQVFKTFFDKAQQIDKSYFTSKQGLKLGLDKNVILKKYSKPDLISIIDNVEKIEWNYKGDYYFEETGESPTGIIAKDSFGYQMIMYFKNDKLVGLIIKNDIP